jgi:hypothetical protein
LRQELLRAEVIREKSRNGTKLQDAPNG